MKWLLTLLLLLAAPARADRVLLQPETLRLGDIALFVIEYDSKLPSLYALDTSILEQDFELLRKDSRISRLTNDNPEGHRMQWRLQITPRRSGRLVIPSIRYGERRTTPLEVEVGPRPVGEARVWVELDSFTPDPYVGQQIRLSARLFHDLPVDQRIAETPEAGDLNLRRSTPEKIYRSSREGRQLGVLEQEFVLFPRQAGQLRVSPAGYRVTIGDNDADRRIVRRSEPLELPVRGPPADFGGEFWLPAIDLRLQQQWGGKLSDLRVGDSMDLTVKIIARGLPAESLPADLLQQTDARIRVYADQAVLDNRFENGDIVGQLEQRFAIVATAPGTIELPGLGLRWWDVVNDRAAESRLEGRVFRISGSAGRSFTGAAANPVEIAVTLIGIDYKPWIALLAGLLLLAAMIAVFSLLKRRVGAAIETLSRRRRVRQALQRACHSNDAALARAALIDWARLRWPEKNIVGLRQVDGDEVSAGLRRQLAELDAALYGNAAPAWQGQALWDSLRRIRPKPRPAARVSAARLPALYPRRV